MIKKIYTCDICKKEMEEDNWRKISVSVHQRNGMPRIAEASCDIRMNCLEERGMKDDRYLVIENNRTMKEKISEILV